MSTDMALTQHITQALWIFGVLFTLIVGAYGFTFTCARYVMARLKAMESTSLSKGDIHQLTENIKEVSCRLDSLISAILSNNIKLSVTPKKACKEKE